MKKTISILLAFVMMFFVSCSCKTPEEKKAEAFAKAVEENDTESMIEYVEKHFEWSDLLSEDTEFKPSALDSSTMFDEFEEAQEDWKEKGEIVIAEITILSDFSQINPSNTPFLVQKAKIKKIYKDYSGSPTLKKNDVVYVTTFFSGIYTDGAYSYPRTTKTCRANMLNPGHTYIANLRFMDKHEAYHSEYIFPTDYDKEYEFLKPYTQEKVLRYTATSFMRESKYLDFARDMFDFCGVNYTVPESEYEFPVIIPEKENETEKEKAFREAVAKCDQNAINEYVRNYFEWADIFDKDAELVERTPNYALDFYSFDEYDIEIAQKRDLAYVEITVLPGFDQTLNDSGDPVITQKAQIKKIYMNYDESYPLKENDIITVCTSFVGLDKDGRYQIYETVCSSCEVFVKGHTYIGVIDRDDMYCQKFFPTDYNGEYQFYDQYSRSKLYSKLIKYMNYYQHIEFAQDMFEFCKVSDKYVIPSDPDWYK